MPRARKPSASKKTGRVRGTSGVRRIKGKKNAAGKQKFRLRYRKGRARGK